MNEFDGQRFCNLPEHLTMGVDSRWPSGNVPWAITSLIPGVTENDYRLAVVWSLDAWAAAGGITPKEVDAARLARILCTSRRIDGPAGVLGETELPMGGIQQVRMWLDTSDNWDVQWPPADPRKIPLYVTVLHELGHALGIGHAPQGTTAVMSPFLQSQLRGLMPWDVQEVRRRYGPPVAQPADPTNPVPPVPVPGDSFMATILKMIAFLSAHPEILDLIKRLFGLFEATGKLTVEDVQAECQQIQQLRA